MTTREKMRIILCEAISPKIVAFDCTNESILQGFRQSCETNFGAQGMGAFGLPTRVVLNLTKQCGLFAIRVPSTYATDAVACVGLIIALSNRPITVRVLHISGRMKNTITATIDRAISWRNNLPQDYAIPRKSQLDTSLREILNSLSALPSYA